MKNYPNVSDLFRMKSEWRQSRAKRPISEKIEAVGRLRQLSKEVPRLRGSQSNMKKAK